MGDTSLLNETAEVKEKPALGNADVVFPPFPEPTQNDFEEDISTEEREYYKTKFSDLNIIKTMRLHCTACDRHLGCSARNESRMRVHPMLRTLICQTCLSFYNSGEFDKGDDGSELYCRWCGQGGQVYCCADCPHVFCAKCVKRNLGVQKIKEIEDLDDWKCFKCNPRCIWDLRANCWAVLRYCDLKNQITYKTQDPDLKEKYQKSCITDSSECCKKKSKVKEKTDTKKKDESTKKNVATFPSITKVSPAIQVKKFASILIDDFNKDKKPQKRPASPKQKVISVKNPIPIAAKPGSTISLFNKRLKLCSTPVTPIRINMEKKSPQTYVPVKPTRVKAQKVMPFNGFNNYTITNDNINLSLENLTQGLDMSAVAGMSSGSGQDDDVVCTPDFLIEPLCEVSEDATDDDVQCITPAPTYTPTATIKGPPPLLSKNPLPDLTPGNIIQMTDNDVTVNAATGGLKFRVDPQTLSSNKMYRLPDGRIFAINANPNMPGGYSATIVAVTDNVSSKLPPKGATYAAKLSAVLTQPSKTLNKSNPSTTLNKSNVRSPANSNILKRNISNVSSNSSNSVKSPQYSKTLKPIERRSSRPCDMDVPVEWYRYNLIDAVDALEYSLSRLNQLKQQANTMFLRTRNVHEMRHLHKTLERLLNTSANRFLEIKENLNKELKNYIEKKENRVVSDDDDDDVEILPDDNNDDPIFIDENSMESRDSHEVDLTGHGSSEHDSSGKSLDNTSNLNNDDCVHVDSGKPMICDAKGNDENNTDASNDPLIPDIELKEEVSKDTEQVISNNVNSDDVTEKELESEKEVLEEGNAEISCKEMTTEVASINEGNAPKATPEETNNSDKKTDNTISDEIIDNMSCNTKTEDKSEKSLHNEMNENGSKDVEMSEKEIKDIEINEKEKEDIEMSEAAIEENEMNEKMMEDSEMSEKAIEELLKDDNEGNSDNVNNHSNELSSEIKND